MTERERARLYFEMAGAMLVVLDPDGRVRRINRAGAQILGAPPEDIIGRDWIASFVPERHRAAAAALLERLHLAEQAGQDQAEGTVLRSDGRERMIAWRSAPLRDTAGRLAGILISGEDVTERREAEIALRDSEERLRLALEGAAMGEWEANLGVGTYMMSARARRLHGASPDEPLDEERVWQLVHPDDRERVRVKLCAGVAARRSRVTAEYRSLWPDGTVRWLAAWARLSEDEAGPRLVGVAQDITRRHAVEAALRDSEERLRQITETIEDVFWVVEPAARRTVYVSPAFDRVWGRPKAELMAEFDLWFSAIEPGDRERARAAFAASRTLGGGFDIEYRIRRPDGTVRWVRNRGFAVPEPDGTPPHRVAGVASDITERRRIEEQRELLVRELNHRVKNVLATVQSIASQTLRTTGDDPALFAERFTERLRVLARAHDLLTARAWNRATLEDVTTSTLAPWLAGGRIAIAAGPPVSLSPRQSQALMLALHELVTNAAKHGALSDAAGQVNLAWHLTDEGETRKVLLDWRESGGPPVTGEPKRRGFGTRLLQRGLASDLGNGATVDLNYLPGGLHAKIRFPPAA